MEIRYTSNDYPSDQQGTMRTHHQIRVIFEVDSPIGFMPDMNRLRELAGHMALDTETYQKRKS